MIANLNVALLFFKLTEAKELYRATHESAFNLDHCWGILKDTPKWQATQQEVELKSIKSKKPRESQSTKELPSESTNIPTTDDAQPSSPQPITQVDDGEDKE